MRFFLLIGVSMSALLFTLMPHFHPEGYLNMQYHWWSDVLFHSGYFYVATALLLALLCKKRVNWLLVAGIILCSTSLEVLQLWVPGRTFSVMDMGSNYLGTAVALLMHLLRRSRTGFLVTR